MTTNGDEKLAPTYSIDLDRLLRRDAWLAYGVLLLSLVGVVLLLSWFEMYPRDPVKLTPLRLVLLMAVPLPLIARRHHPWLGYVVVFALAFAALMGVGVLYDTSHDRLMSDAPYGFVGRLSFYCAPIAASTGVLAVIVYQGVGRRIDVAGRALLVAGSILLMIAAVGQWIPDPAWFLSSFEENQPLIRSAERQNLPLQVVAGALGVGLMVSGALTLRRRYRVLAHLVGGQITNLQTIPVSREVVESEIAADAVPLWFASPFRRAGEWMRVDVVSAEPVDYRSSPRIIARCDVPDATSWRDVAILDCAIALGVAFVTSVFTGGGSHLFSAWVNFMRRQ